MLALAACGGKDNAPVVQTSPVATTPDTSGFVGGACASQVVQDYRDLSFRCRELRDRDRDGDRCRALAVSFLQTYPNVSCTATATDGRGFVREYRIEAPEVEERYIDGRERGPVRR
jgi:hypothetical protein